MDKQIKELDFNKIVKVINKSKIGQKFLFRVGNLSYYINCTATMKTIAKRPCCAICGAKATHAILCKNEQDSYYVSFFTERNGQLILFTKDHIVPRSEGGSNSMSNLQACCETCNRAKGNETDSNAEALIIRQLKDEINKLRSELTRQQSANTKNVAKAARQSKELSWFRRHWWFRLMEKYYKKYEGKWLV